MADGRAPEDRGRARAGACHGQYASLRAHRLAGLARRLAQASPAARGALQARIEALRQAPGDGRGHAPSPAAARGAVAMRGALGHLADELEARRGGAAAAGLSALVLEAEATWQLVRMRSLLRPQRAKPVEDAGPLNSGKLAWRAITTMQALSPGYARHFLQYLDTLGSIEAMLGAQGAELATPGADAKPRRPPRPRKRKPAAE